MRKAITMGSFGFGVGLIIAGLVLSFGLLCHPKNVAVFGRTHGPVPCKACVKTWDGKLRVLTRADLAMPMFNPLSSAETRYDNRQANCCVQIRKPPPDQPDKGWLAWLKSLLG